MNLKSVLRGTGVAIITPFNENKEVDFDALEKLIDFNINNGVNYIVTLGTTGETPVLSSTEKKDIIKFTIDKINGKVPVVVGMGGNDTQSLVKEIETASLEKATAILSASPYYNKPSQQGIYQHYKVIAKASPLPVILYNVPGRTGRNMTSETSLKLAHEVENIAGIKEASGDMIQCMEILRDKPDDFLVVSGDDMLALPQLACGMDGVISVVANCYPKEFSNLVKNALDGNLLEAKKINDFLLPAYNYLFSENNPAGVKAFLYEMKLIKNELRLPGVAVENQLQEKIKKFVSS